jgi:hypothetical protein
VVQSGPSSAWAAADGPRARRAARIGAGVALVVFVLLATSGQPWRLLERGPFSSDFYDVQARALSRGHLAVPAEAASIEGFVHDGEVHFYYGLVPAIARVPVSAFTDALDGRLGLVSMVGGLAVGALAAARLLQRARAALGVEVAAPHWAAITGGFAAAVGVDTPLLWLSSRAIVYHEAELWGAALAILGFERVVAWWSSGETRDLAWASGAAALALSTRGSSGAGPALAIGVLALVLAAHRRWGRAALSAVAAGVPVVLYGAVNMLRFGTPFSVPFDAQVLNDFSAARRAALADNGDTLFGLKFVPTALLQYLRPDTVSPRALAPWISWDGRARVIGDVTFDTVDRAASLPVAAPAFVVAAGVGCVVLVRRRLRACWPISLLAAAAAVVPTLAIAFIAQRYLADFVPALVVGACVGVPAIAAWTAADRRRRPAVVAVTGVLLAAALAVNAGLAVLARHVYLLPSTAERRAFVAAQYDVHDALGGGRPPAVVEVAALGAPAADGTVAIVGDCDGLFRSIGDEWVLLELRPGGAQRARVTGSTPGPVVAGDGWRVVLEVDGTTRRLVYEGPTRVEGAPLDDSGPIEVDVSTLPNVPTVIVHADGEPSLEAFLQPAGGALRTGAGWTPIDGDAPLCRTLQRRLG